MTDTKAKWTERVREWKASGRTAKEFASGKDFKPSTLTYWASLLRRKPGIDVEQTTSVPRVRMVRVVSAATPPAPGETLVVNVGAAQVVVRAGFDGELLRNVVLALGGGR